MEEHRVDAEAQTSAQGPETSEQTASWIGDLLHSGME